MKPKSFMLATVMWKARSDAASVEIAATPEMVLVDGGVFQMGGYVSEGEEPVHRITVNTYHIGKYPVTVRQYRSFCAATRRDMPCGQDGWDCNDQAPVVNVTYNDALDYCDWLSKNYGGNWRLPSEAEWEYAARGGIRSMGYMYSGSDNLSTVGWFGGNINGGAVGIGRKQANELGIYDMSGNVWEWCRDWYDIEYYGLSPALDPEGPVSGTRRVLRGGAWDEIPLACRVAYRGHLTPQARCANCGFRVVLSQ